VKNSEKKVKKGVDGQPHFMQNSLPMMQYVSFEKGRKAG